MGAKCTYYNPELAHIRVGLAKVSSYASHVGLRVTFVRRTRGGTYKIKDSDAQVSICVRRIRESMYKQVCKQVCMCVDVDRV